MSHGSNKKNYSSEEDFVTMEVLKDMLKQRKHFYVEILNRQDTNFMCFTKLIMETTSARTDGIMKEVQELKSSLQFSQAQINELLHVEKKVGLLEIQLQSMLSQYTVSGNNDIISQMHYLENQN